MDILLIVEGSYNFLTITIRKCFLNTMISGFYTMVMNGKNCFACTLKENIDKLNDNNEEKI